MVYNDTVKMVRPQNIRLQQNHDIFWVMVISMYNLLVNRGSDHVETENNLTAWVNTASMAAAFVIYAG